jgi:hypothetical protein
MKLVADNRDNLVSIEPDGRVVIGTGAARRLSQHPGKFRVVPTTGELVLLQRVQSKGDASVVQAVPPGRVALAGEIDGVGGLVDVINFICGNGWSGQLAIVDGPVRKSLFFRRGDIRTAASNVSEDRLGAILYRFGVISEQQLAEALNATHAATRLGHVLVERGYLTPHDLYTYVRKQIEEIFFSVLVVTKGNFYFYRTGDDDGPASQLQLSTKTMLFDGVRRIDELSYFREKIPSSEVVLVPRHPQPEEKLGPREQRVLDLTDGVRTLEMIARITHLGDFETTKILYQLLQSGYVGRKEERQSIKMNLGRPNDTMDDMYGRIIDTFNAVYAKIHAAVSLKGKEQALQQGLESFFGSVADFAPLFVGVALAPDGTLPRETIRANLAMAPTDNKLEYLHRGLNELLFFELFTAGEAVDRREEIELHQRLNQILREVPGDDELEPEITVERSDPDAA